MKANAGEVYTVYNISFSLHSQINWLRTKNQSAEIRFSFSAD